MYQEQDRSSVQSRSDCGSAYKDQLRAQLRENYVSNRAERKSQQSHQSQASRDSASKYPVDYRPQLSGTRQERFGIPAQQQAETRGDVYHQDVYRPGAHYSDMMHQGTKTPSELKANRSKLDWPDKRVVKEEGHDLQGDTASIKSESKSRASDAK